MNRIPTFPLLIGLAGLVPFLWGAATYLSADLGAWGATHLGPRFVGPYVQLFYGSVVLSFMSGVLWGFAARARGGQGTTGYVLAVLPALWAFFMTGGGPVTAGMNLIFGFAGLLLLDAAFAHWGLAPSWWLQLRLRFTGVVIACLAVGVWL